MQARCCNSTPPQEVKLKTDTVRRESLNDEQYSVFCADASNWKNSLAYWMSWMALQSRCHDSSVQGSVLLALGRSPFRPKTKVLLSPLLGCSYTIQYERKDLLKKPFGFKVQQKRTPKQRRGRSRVWIYRGIYRVYVGVYKRGL